MLPEDGIELSELTGLSVQAMKDLIFDKVKARYASQMEKLSDPERQLEFQRAVILRVVDNNWSEHIDALDQMRQSVGLRGYAQNNPIVEYQEESYKMYNNMIGAIEFEVTRLMMKAQIQPQTAIRQEAPRMTTTASQENITNVDTEHSVSEEISFENVGRNDLCPCGSGKKFKNCHGRTHIA